MRSVRTSGSVVLAVTFGILIIFMGCQTRIDVGPGGVTISTTIGGLTFGFAFGTAASPLFIDVTANQTSPATPVGFRLFEETPPETPPSGSMTLRSSDVGVGRVLTAKQAVRSQTPPVNGTATVRFSIAAGQSAALCSSATFLAEYDLTLNAGALSVVDEVQELSQAALAVIVQNEVTICVEVTADFSGQISFTDFSFSFGGGTPGSAVFRVYNNDAENIHFLLPGDSFDETNRVSPGAAAERSLGVDVGDAITVRAGRNGQVLDTVTCPVVAGSNYTAHVEWSGLVVTCDAEQRGGGVPVAPQGTSLQVPIDSSGDAVAPTATYNGIDYGIVGVLDDNTSTVYTPTLPTTVTVDLAELGLQYVERIYLATYSAWIPDVPDGVTIATLSCAYAEDGSPTTYDLVAGSTTAEWSWERPEHQALYGTPHNLAPILYSYDTTQESASMYEAHIYGGTFALDTARTLSSLNLILADPAAYLSSRSPDNGVPTWAGQGILGVTLVGPAGIPGGGGGQSTETGSVTGQVVNAQNGTPLANVVIRVDGTSLTTTTDALGNFMIDDVPSGSPVLVASLTGFVQTSATVLVFPNAETETSIGMLELGAGGDDVAAVLAWGAAPSDLDLHMSGPDGAGGRFHAYYSVKTPVAHVELDLDDTSSFGPETMTVSPAEGGAYVAGDYHVWVRNFSGTPAFAESAATLTLFAGGSQLAQYSVGGASGDSNKRIWLVVQFTVSESGSVSNIEVVQSFEDGNSGDVF